MNLSLKLHRRECVKHCGEEIVCGALALMAEPRFFCGQSSQSSTAQASNNYQVASQSAPGGPSVAIGSGSSTGAINTTTADSGNVQTNSNNTTISGDIATSTAALELAAGVSATGAALGGQALVTAEEMSQHSEDIVSSIGGAAINLGSNVALGALQFAQNNTELNYNALNQNTALAFSTINALDTAQASGAVSAAAQDTLRAATMAAANVGATPTVIYQPGASQPYAGTTGTGGSIDSTTLLLIAGAAIVIFLVVKHK